ncbi:MAG: hypothetical protein PGN13_06700 [Patulibacter minatonensis]
MRRTRGERWCARETGDTLNRCVVPACPPSPPRSPLPVSPPAHHPPGLPARATPRARPATAAAAKTAAAKKKRTTAQRVTALSRSLNRAKAQQRAAQKQLDAVVKQQTAIGDTLSKAISPLGAINLAAPGGLLAALQDPSTGVPGYLDGIKTAAVDSLKQLLASQEYAVIAVTIGDSGVYVSPTPLISGDISDIGAPVTVSGTVPIAVPGGLGSERLDVRIGAVSLENEKGGVADPPFYANLNHLSVTPAGFTGDVGDARLTGGWPASTRARARVGRGRPAPPAPRAAEHRCGRARTPTSWDCRTGR